MEIYMSEKTKAVFVIYQTGNQAELSVDPCRRPPIELWAARALIRLDVNVPYHRHEVFPPPSRIQHAFECRRHHGSIKLRETRQHQDQSRRPQPCRADRR